MVQLPQRYAWYDIWGPGWGIETDYRLGNVWVYLHATYLEARIRGEMRTSPVTSAPLRRMEYLDGCPHRRRSDCAGQVYCVADPVGDR